MVAEVIKKEGKIDVLINCAGVSISGPTLDFSADDFMKLLDINAVGAFRMIKPIVPYRPRLIINITSLNSFLSLPNFGIYAASKFALEAVGRAVGYELGPETKLVNVAPGALLNENPAHKMVHKPAREKFPLLNWIMPLTKMDLVANKVVELINSKSVPTLVCVGNDAKMIYLAEKLLPRGVIDWAVSYFWRKK